jgi:3-hydroxyacyl-CoA dehydrogenase
VEIAGDGPTFFEKARARAAALKRGPAPEAIVDCVEAAATLPPEEAAGVELASFERLSTTTQSLALRHLFFAERMAARIEGLDKSVKSRPVSRVGVLGAGTMGTGIAMAFANAGYSVILTDTSDAAMARSRTVREKAYASAIKRGRMSEAEAGQNAALISESSSLEAMSQCQLVIEAVVERMEVKQAVLGQLSGVLEPGAIIASNTSYLDIDVLAQSTGRSGDFLGLHFFSPAHVMKLVEVVRGRETSAEVLATAMEVVKRIGKTGVLAGVCDGFIGNRMIDQYFLQANELLMEGASPAEVDSALRDFGFAMGPFEMSDMAGNDIGWMSRKRRLAADANYSFPAIADAICEKGWFGQKTGKGHYVYEEGGREPKDSAEFNALLSRLRSDEGIAARTIEPREIVERCVYALVNEGARILEEGIAQRASDIDVVYVRGYGFPDLKGGPMHYAQSVGIERVIHTLGEFHRRSGDPFWLASPMLAKLVAE